jgi:hypothetical protein
MLFKGPFYTLDRHLQDINETRGNDAFYAVHLAKTTANFFACGCASYLYRNLLTKPLFPPKLLISYAGFWLCE